jgi:hypothetical protein
MSVCGVARYLGRTITPNLDEIDFGFWQPSTGKLPLRVLCASARDHLVDVEGLSRSRVERSDALLDVAPKRTEPFDTGMQLPADLLLDRLRQGRCLCDGILERTSHTTIIA